MAIDSGQKNYPECEKWANLLDRGGKMIIQFFEFLDEKGYGLVDSDNRYIHETTEKLLQQFGNVDPVKLEAERQDMLNSLR